MVVVDRKAGFSVSVTEHGVTSPAGIFEFDKPKTAEEYFHSFCDLGGAKLVHAESGKLALVCGVASGLVVLRIGRGSFVPDLKPGRYGVEHTAIGNLFTKTKRIMDLNTGTAHAIFGIIRNEWPDGLNSCTLVQPDLEDNRGSIQLLADDSEIPIEPTPGYRFYTAFYHIPGAGSAYSSANSSDVYPLYHLGIMTLSREQLSELLRAFNKDWSNGPVFARRNNIGGNPSSGTAPPKRRSMRKKNKKEGLDKWS